MVRAQTGSHNQEGTALSPPQSLASAAKQAAEKAFSCHSEACFSPKNLSVGLTYIEDRFFASLRMTQKRGFSAACKADPCRVGTAGLEARPSKAKQLRDTQRSN